MVSRETKNNAYAKLGGTNEEYRCIFRSGLLTDGHFPIPQRELPLTQENN